MGTSSGFCSSLKCTRDISLVPPEKETTYIASHGKYAKELRATVLTGPLVLSLVALLPQTNLGWAALVLSLIGLANHFILGWNLSRHAQRKWISMVRRAALILVGFLLYGYELYNAILLLLFPTDSTPISALAPLLVGIYALGLARAWQLLGGRNYGLSDWLSPLHDTEGRQPVTNMDQSHSTTSVKKDKAT